MKLWLVLAMGILAVPLPLLARESTDLIIMRNGDRMTGEIKGLSSGVLSVKLKYAQGTISLEWSQVAQLQSAQLFLIHTDEGAVYTGTLSTNHSSSGEAAIIEIASSTKSPLEIAQPKVVTLNQAEEGFWRSFDGSVNTGIQYSKGNQTTQYNVATQLGYLRPRWSSQVNINSSLAHNAGASSSTRNQASVNATRLLRWNNWFYQGTGNFLQSSVQGIRLQSTLGGGIGRYLKNSNEVTLYVLGGLAWQNAQYKDLTTTQPARNTATGLVKAELKTFKFKKTNLDVMAVIVPEMSEPGRVRADTNASYYIKLWSDLSWNFSFYGSWDNRPPAPLSGSDYGTSSGLSWTFGSRQ